MKKQKTPRHPKLYPSDLSDEERSIFDPYLTLIRLDSKQREHDLRVVFNSWNWFVHSYPRWRMMPHDFLVGGSVLANAML